MFLTNKTDSEIVDGLKLWVAKEREAVSYVLHYLREVEERKLYLKQASSLYEYCMKVHDYSRHEALARIDAMRLMKTAPEIAMDLDAGRLSLTVAAQVQSAFRQEDARRKTNGEKPLSKSERQIVLEDLKSVTTREADRRIATHFPQQLPAKKTKPVNEDVTQIAFNAGADLMRQLERLQAIYHHQTGGKWEKLFQILAAHQIERLDAPLRRAPSVRQKTPKRPDTQEAGQSHDRPSADQGSTPTSPAQDPAAVGNTRYIRKQIHRQVKDVHIY